MERGKRDLETWIEMLSEIVREKGKVAFTHDWDSGGPGAGAGREVVYKFQDQYWPDSDTEGLYGPMKTLEAALASGDLLTVTDATTEISGDHYDEELVAKLEGTVEYGERDLDTWIEILTKIVRDQGRIVFRHKRDSGDPSTGAGVEVVYEFGSLYWPQSDSDGVFGPMDTLDDALVSSGFLKTTSDTASIDCPEIDGDELLTMLEGLTESGLKWIFINGEAWVLTLDRGFKRKSDASFG